MMIMTMGKPTKRVREDDYYNSKGHYSEMKEYMDIKPVDMYGNCAPVGNSASDRSRNLNNVEKDLHARVGIKNEY